MQRISRKTVTIIIIVSILFVLTLSASTFFEVKVIPQPSEAWNDNLPGIRLIGIGFALYCLFAPVVLNKKLLSIINKPDQKQWKAINALLALRFALVICTVVGGQILVHLGMGLLEFVCYIAASIIGILVWGVITLRGK